MDTIEHAVQKEEMLGLTNPAAKNSKLMQNCPTPHVAVTKGLSNPTCGCHKGAVQPHMWLWPWQ